MSEPAISIRGLSKRYALGATLKHDTLRDHITHAARSMTRMLPFKKNPKKNEKKTAEDFWALKDVSFDVQPGEIVGIIGRNGAGKSTLLKILSQITDPTEGEVRMRGRVASLLEVGTGFHPELTGMENIFLNGSILGMPRQQIRKNLDRIIDFAGIEQFIDTPVKRYSSGMYVRLAFAVAAHLEPDVLMVDEVLAVGDVGFQTKCFGKMSEVAREGRTVLLISHQLGLVGQLCDRAVILQNGRLLEQGSAENMISKYLLDHALGNNGKYSRPNAPSDTPLWITKVRSTSSEGSTTTRFSNHEEIELHITIKNESIPEDVRLAVAVKDHLDRRVFSNELLLNSFTGIKSNSTVTAVLSIPKLFLLPGRYTFLTGIHVPNIKEFDTLDHLCPIEIYDTGSDFSIYGGVHIGCVYSNAKWKLKSE
ncbi:ABC transporter ATP-binding protein [bacterium]|nr:ABC transporter ATP-binding protein [bacterium]